LAAFRCAVAAVLLLAVGLGAGLRPPGPRARDWLRVAGAGVLGNTAFHLCMVTGVHHTSPAHAALLIALSPLFAALLARLALGEPVGTRRLVGILLAFTGVGVIVLRGETPGGGSWRGDLLSLGASLSWAAYTVLGKPLLARSGAREATTWATLFGTLPLLPLGLPGLAAVPWSALSPGRWLLLAYLSAGTIALANLLWYWALARAATARVVAFSYLVPLVATGVALAAGQEALTASLLAGGLAIVGGVALAQRAGAPGARPAPAGPRYRK
jgi:drug/metabolite transporter (DMT)-like permease